MSLVLWASDIYQHLYKNNRRRRYNTRYNINYLYRYHNRVSLSSRFLCAANGTSFLLFDPTLRLKSSASRTVCGWVRPRVSGRGRMLNPARMDRPPNIQYGSHSKYFSCIPEWIIFELHCKCIPSWSIQYSFIHRLRNLVSVILYNRHFVS